MLKVSGSRLESMAFLLYVSVMLVITFLQQEYVLLPELQNLDIIGEDVKVQLLDRYQSTRWLSFLLVPVLLLLRLIPEISSGTEGASSSHDRVNTAIQMPAIKKNAKRFIGFIRHPAPGGVCVKHKKCGAVSHPLL